LCQWHISELVTTETRFADHIAGSHAPEQVTLVRDSFAKVTPIAPAAASMFYERLFVLDRALRPLFKGDMTEQGRKLMAMIGNAVANLDRLGDIVPAVQHSADVMPDTASVPATTILWPTLCYRRWNKASAPISPRPRGTPGRRVTGCSPVK
jgi:hypothetical protein